MKSIYKHKLFSTAIFYIVLAIAALYLTAPAHAAGNWKGQCITGNGKAVPAQVTPDGKLTGKTVGFAAFMVTEDNGKYVHLTTVPNYDLPDPDSAAGKDAGWVAKKDMVFQDLRNCN